MIKKLITRYNVTLVTLHHTNFNSFVIYPDLILALMKFFPFSSFFLFLSLSSFYVIFQALLNSNCRESRNKLESLLFGVRAIPCRRFLD